VKLPPGSSDVSQRQGADTTLRVEEEPFRRYFDLGLIGMAMTSPSKGILEVNGELCRILGYEQNELLQKTWAEITHPDDLTADVSQFNRVLSGEIDGYTLDKRWIRKDGRVIDSIMSAKCMRLANGAVDYCVGLILDVTERKRAEEALREAHDQTQMILNSLHDRFFAVDSQWRYTYFNRRAEAQLVTLGKDPASLMGRLLWEEFPKPPSEEMFRRAMRERITLTGEHYYAPLGEWVENRVHPTSDGGLAIFQHYVTERKRAEGALRASEEKYRTLYESMDEGFCIIEVLFDENEKPIDYRFLEVNPSFEKQTGIKDAVGRRMREIAPAHEEHWFEIYGKIASTGDPMRFEKVAAHLNRWYDVCAFRVGPAQERKVAVLFNDISARKQAEAKLRESERRFRLFAESIPQHVWSFRSDGILNYWNQRLSDYTGLTAEELRSGGWAALHPDYVARVEAAWQEARAHGTDYDMEQRMRGRDGKYRRFLCRAVAIKDDEGGGVEWFGTNTDVEELRQTEEALRTAQAELAHVTRVVGIGELTASIAHEISQPLTVIVSNANACQRFLQADHVNLDEIRAAVTDIVMAGERTAEVIAQIRNLLKKRTPEKVPLSVNQLVHEAIALVPHVLEKHRILIRTDLTPGLPQVLGDRIQLEQVILNLIMNGVEAMMPVDSRPRALTLRSLTNEEGNVLVEVIDSGIGLLSTSVEQMFETFFTTKPSGMGMGLSISRSIISAHGGQLWAMANAQDEGATFQFSLPGIA
jgi:PAS domain S-box-containing protein